MLHYACVMYNERQAHCGCEQYSSIMVMVPASLKLVNSNYNSHLVEKKGCCRRSPVARSLLLLFARFFFSNVCDVTADSKYPASCNRGVMLCVRFLRINKQHTVLAQRTRGKSRGSVATRTKLSDLFDFGLISGV